MTATSTRRRGCRLLRGPHLPPSDVCGDVRGPLTTSPWCAPRGRRGPLGWATWDAREPTGPCGSDSSGPKGALRVWGEAGGPGAFLGAQGPPKPQLTTAGPGGSLTPVLLCRGLRPQKPRPASGECPSLCITVNWSTGWRCTQGGAASDSPCPLPNTSASPRRGVRVSALGD